MARITKGRFKVTQHVSLEKRGQVWYAIVKRFNKAPQELSMRTTERNVAIQRIKDTQLEENAAKAYALGMQGESVSRLRTTRKTTLWEAAQECYARMRFSGIKDSTVRSTATVFDRFLRTMQLEDRPPADLERGQLDRFLNTKHRGAKITTLRRVAWSLEAVCRSMYLEGVLATNPAADLRIKTDHMTQEQLLPTDREPFTLDELDRLIASCERGSFWWCAIQISVQSGLRLGDVVALQWASIKEGHIEVSTGKRNIYVKHKMTPALKAVFDTIKREPGEAYLFPEMFSHHAASPSYLSKTFARMCYRLNIEGKSFHSLRHTFKIKRELEERANVRASLMAEITAQLALEQTQKAMGHSNAESTKGYGNVPESELGKYASHAGAVAFTFKAASESDVLAAMGAIPFESVASMPKIEPASDDAGVVATVNLRNLKLAEARELFRKAPNGEAIAATLNYRAAFVEPAQTVVTSTQ